MKLILFYYFLFSFNSAFSQDYISFKDTIQNFEILIPKHWKYGIPKGSGLSLLALATKVDDDVPRENFNINIRQTDTTDFERYYTEFLNAISTVEGFEILEKNQIIIHDTKYTILIERHKNPINKENMVHTILFTNKNNKLLILTLVTTLLRFEKSLPLFETIISNFKF